MLPTQTQTKGKNLTWTSRVLNLPSFRFVDRVDRDVGEGTVYSLRQDLHGVESIETCGRSRSTREKERRRL